MKTQHTPGPWKIIGNPNLVMVEITNNPDFAGKHTVVCNCDYQQTLVGGSKHANAEFIVRACNAHEELLEALQTMIDAFNVKEIDPLVACASIEKAKAAIQKAQGD